ncbi:MAG TPA: SBBP repeat-containing protein [candidate division Zixibacteria bacterium]|nr:SBBP repeat-containing protein [candidate division Zixibacteria bacterium]
MERVTKLLTVLVAYLIILIISICGTANAVATPQLLDGDALELCASNLLFIPNHGQFSSLIDYRADVSRSTIWFSQYGVYLQLFDSTVSDLPIDPFDQSGFNVEESGDPVDYVLIRLEPVDGDLSRPAGTTAIRGNINYFRTNNPANWVTGVQAYDGLLYDDVYPGIDLRFKNSNKRLEYDFEIGSGVSPDPIRMRYYGVDSLYLSADGDLVVVTELGEFFEYRPLIYQFDGEEQVPVEGSFVIYDDNSFGFSISPLYDTGKPLVIDPVLTFSTYFGGVGNDISRALALDDDGYVYVTGYVKSVDFPLIDPYDPVYHGEALDNYDAFITKISPDGDTVIYSTFLGGSDGDDKGFMIKVDGTSAAIIAGATASTDFPTVGALQSTNAGGQDGFITKLTPAGDALAFSTYFGGSAYDVCIGLDLDSGSKIYFAGHTQSADLPTAGTPYDGALDGARDGYYAVMAADGSALEYVTFIGGTDEDYAVALAVDEALRVYLTGYTASTDFPIFNAAYPTFAGGNHIGDAFVTCFETGGASLVYSTYLGGAVDDFLLTIGLDSLSQATVGGYTYSNSYPTVNAYDATFTGYYKAIVTQLNPTGDTVRFSTYLGGSGDEVISGLAISENGYVFVTGNTTSMDFPTEEAFDPLLDGGSDAFLTCFSPDGGALAYSTYYGGTGYDFGYGLAVDQNRNVFWSGYTNSIDIDPIGALQDTIAGAYDLFFARVDWQEYICIDSDNDGFGDPGHPENMCPDDNCPYTHNPLQSDSDADGAGNACDNCNDLYNPDQSDYDGDGLGDSCDVCTDFDNDGYGDPGFPENTCETDNCPDNYNPGQEDTDGDGIGDLCDECTDSDGDGYGDPGYSATTCTLDNCPDIYNPDQEDLDGDGVGDSCDICLETYNPGQEDFDADGLGDSCDTCTDYDGDGYGNPGFPANTCDNDNCPYTYNPDQIDTDGNGVGDACDSGCCVPPIRGNIDNDPAEEISISDLVYMVNYLFNGGPPPPCMEEANINGEGASDNPDITDLIHMVDYMFSSGPPPADCP